MEIRSDFLGEINAVINIKDKTLKVGSKCITHCLSAYDVASKNRSKFKLVAAENISLQPMCEARVEAEIVGSFPNGDHFVVVGKDIATGVCCNDTYRKLIVFLKSGTVKRKVKAGDTIGIAYRITNPEIVKDDTGIVNELSMVDKSKSKKEIDLSKVVVGQCLNRNKLLHSIKNYKYALDGKDPNLNKLRKIRNGKSYWNHPGSKGRIFTPNDEMPIYVPQFRQSPAYAQAAEDMVRGWLKDGLVRESFSSWNAPVLIVKKPNGGLRFCVDYRQLNKITQFDAYPMPRIDEILDDLGNAKVFSKIDLQWGFYNVELAEEDKHKTAFSLKSGHYEWNVLSMGLKNSPATFQRVMTDVFRPLIGKCVHVFIDDILIYSESPTKHYKDVEEVLKLISDNGFKVNLKKSEFGTDTLEYLGFTIFATGVSPKRSQVNAVLKMPRPTNMQQLRSFTGMCNVFRWMISRFADLTAPLDKLKRKGQVMERDWGPAQDAAFIKLKESIASNILVYRVDWKKR